MKRFHLVLIVFILLISPAFSQEFDFDRTPEVSLQSTEIQPVSPIDINTERLLLSMSTEDYPVTPGDVYNIAYLRSSQQVTHQLLVESDYTVNFNIFGKINAGNLTFTEFKKIIENKISAAYPDSVPSITILSTGLFQVYIKGEVKQSTYITCWGLTRLNQIIGGPLTTYSSIRDVKVIHTDGSSKQFDLFIARRFGIKEEDPCLKPGDIIVVSKREREIRISGQVKRPGKYQLLTDEKLEELIEYYGDGFTELADKSRVKLDRFVTGSDKIAESFYLDISQGYDKKFNLNDLDNIYVHQKTKKLPVIYIEGAFNTSLASENGEVRTSSKLQTSNKITVMFNEGTTLYDILWDRRDLISPMADLPNAFLRRDSEESVIPVNIEKLLYEYNAIHDISLKPYDHIIIPFKQFFVAVTGGVQNPGTYPYVPEKTLEYYINLAGGVDRERGSSRRVRIYDQNNKLRPNQSIIDPEDRIYVPLSLAYYVVKYIPLITSSVSAILAILIAGGRI